MHGWKSFLEKAFFKHFLTIVLFCFQCKPICRHLSMNERKITPFVFVRFFSLPVTSVHTARLYTAMLPRFPQSREGQSVGVSATARRTQKGKKNPPAQGKPYPGSFEQAGKAQRHIENPAGIQDDKIPLQSQNRQQDCHQGNAQGSIQRVIQ